MKIKLGELRRIIRESLGKDELALYVWRFPGRIKIALYSPAELLALDLSDRSKLPPGIVKGCAGFTEPDAPCNGAWYVSSIAGIGYGKMLYGLGYRLVPGGLLMPDRFFSSQRAKAAWAKQVGKVKSLPLDDMYTPQTPDPNDDCELQVPVRKGGPDPVLDAAYEGVGVDPGPLVRAHKETLGKLWVILNDYGGEYDTASEVEEKVLGPMLSASAAELFQTEFDKYRKER